jgi:hypothetical protein
MTWKPIVARGFTAPEFESYVEDLKMASWRPSFVVVHNTSAPSAALYRQWQARAGWTGEQWLRNLESYYRGLGWSGGPHLFVAVDKIWAFTPLTVPGTHSPAWNSRTWGVETVEEEMQARNSGGHAHVSVEAQAAPTETMPADNLTSIFWLQQRLNLYGASLVVDGRPGPHTTAAVKIYQSGHGLKADGIAGPLTRLALAKSA